MITYENQNGRRIGGTPRYDIDVRLDGKLVGMIRSVATGWYYKPLKGKSGDIWPTLKDVKRSLEEE